MDAPYVPPMSLQGKFSQPTHAPLMLTDGSSAPGAASAKARSLSSGKIIKQTAGGHMEVTTSITCLPQENIIHDHDKLILARSWENPFSEAR